MLYSTANPDSILQKEEAEFRASDPDLIEESVLEGNRETKIASSSDDAGTSDGPIQFVPLSVNRSGEGRSGHAPSKATIAMMKAIPLSDLQKMTDLFYEKAFRDETLDKFIRSHDDPHGARFAKWIHQKLFGSTVWDEDRAERLRNVEEGVGHVVHDRTSAHVAAWHSPKRPSREVGRRFKLDESRVWMRLHFWAMRESGLMEKSPAFADYYVRFIGHFMSVYESSAPAFARDSLRWSASQKNIDRYIRRNGRKMKDVIGLSLEDAMLQIPKSEANDDEWPYNLEPSTTTAHENEEDATFVITSTRKDSPPSCVLQEGNPYDVHVYYDGSDQRKTAMELRRKLRQQFGDWMHFFPPVDRPIGPHPLPMWEAHFGGHQHQRKWEAVRVFLLEENSKNNNNLSVLIHPNSLDGAYADHSRHAFWVGKTLKLRIQGWRR